MVLTVKCPICGRPVTWNEESTFRPFCSDRCRQVDLGAWAEESYRVPSRQEDEDGGEDNR
ncbi:MAG: DNA gyrase inhibitor YacG [Oxalobacter sp.]|nr:DNA gyrase inhibitor YacG [Oxalobacter sp.]